MRIGAIIQARMSSRRLPGKSLRPLGDKPLIQYVIERLRHSVLAEEILLATSTDGSDDPLVEFCSAMDCGVFRGPLENVARRFLEAATCRGYDAFVRVNGDSPFWDQGLLSRALPLFESRAADVATNVFPRSFPTGFSVEVVRTSALAAALANFDAEDREHVTPFFYRNAERFRIENFSLVPPRRDVCLAVDTREQLDLADEIVRQMSRPHWEYPLGAILEFCDNIRTEVDKDQT